jgi:glycosyltransferase involved in cell wall biosynthesis
MEKVRFSIVLPCYNESANIPILVDRFRKFVGKSDFELILVNNGSTDDSARVFEDIQKSPQNSFARVVSIEKNIGYGHGINSGLHAAAGEILAYSHADVQTPPEDIFRAFEMVGSGEVDIRHAIIKGLRPGREEKELLTRWLRLINWGITGVNIEDINGQPKVFHRTLLNSMTTPVTDFSYDTYVLYIASREGLEIKSIDVEFEERLHGESKWATTFIKKSKTITKYLGSIFLMSWRDRKRKDNPVGQVLRFVVVGITNNIANYFTFIMLLKLLDVHYMISSVTGFIVAFFVSFIMNRSYTFGISGGNIAGQLTRFTMLNVMTLLSMVSTLYIVVDIIGIIPEIGQIFAILVGTTVNFFGLKLWTFSARGD